MFVIPLVELLTRGPRVLGSWRASTHTAQSAAPAGQRLESWGLCAPSMPPGPAVKYRMMDGAGSPGKAASSSHGGGLGGRERDGSLSSPAS